MGDFVVLTDAEIEALDDEGLNAYTIKLERHSKLEKVRQMSKDITEAKKTETKIEETRNNGDTEDSKDTEVTETQKMVKFEKDVIAELTPKEK